MENKTTNDAQTKPVRKNVLKLAQMITGRIEKINTNHIEYRALSALMTDEMVDVAVKMGCRKPKVFSEIQKKTKLDEENLKRILDQLLKTGICEFAYNKNHERVYFVDIPVSGSAELSATVPWQLQNIPEVSEYFEKCSLEPLAPIAQFIRPGGGGIGMHVVPVEQAIKAENASMDVEHISYWLKKYNHFALWPCQCRLTRQFNGMNTGDDPEGWCVALGDFADYIVETNRGRYADFDEVMEIVKKADENGFVHQVTNIDGWDKVFIFCNCNVNSCLALRSSQYYNAPNLSRSAYVAHVDKSKCVACGKCVEKCPAGAVKLGQKLCTKDGEIEYPKHKLPNDHRWGKEMWDPNYRDTNRINCYPTGTAPCKTACPAHIAIQGYIKLAGEGKYEEALELIKRDNPFPAICGRVCNRRCEDACTRGKIDEPIAIDEIKNFIAQRDLDAKTRFVPKKVIPKVYGEFDEKIAIIGGGPAGLSCAYYLALKGYRPTVFEKNAKVGGMMTYGIPSFKLEKDVIEAEIEILRELGVEIKCGVEVGKDVTIQELREQGYKAFYVAIGCQGSRKANVVGEDAEGVESAVDFLRRVTDNHEVKVNGTTVVIGGGNVAIDVARTAHRCGAENVTIISLEQRDEMPASKEEIKEAEDESVVIKNGWGPKEILTDANGKATAIVLKKCTQVRNADGKFAPLYDENDTLTIECDNIFLSIGQCIEWGELLKGTSVQLARNGMPIADKSTYQTDEKDIFVGGDVLTGPKFIIDAIAVGHMASEVLHRFVRVGDLQAGRDRREFVALDKDNLVFDADCYDRPARQIHGMNDAIDAEKSFHDPRLVFTEEQVKKEASRCLGCGAAKVDENKCIGCGVCTNQCKFDAIHLQRDLPECTNMFKYEERVKAIIPYAIKRAISIKRTERAEKKAEKQARNKKD